MDKKSIKEYFTQERNIIDELKRIGLKKIGTYICIIFSFFVTHIFLETIVKFSFSSYLFNIFWILLVTIIISISHHKKNIYLIFYYVIFLLSLIQYFHISIVEKPFCLNQILYFKEGMNYTNSIISTFNINVLLYLIFGIINSIICVKLIKLDSKNKVKKLEKKILIIILIIVLLLGRCVILSTFTGSGSSTGQYIAGFSKKQIYEKFIDKEQAFNMTGIIEYSLREPYLYIKKNSSSNIKEGKEIINNYFEQNNYSSKENDYTGIFKDKNVIFIMAESIDTWLIEEDTMPTVYNMKNNSINFTNRYAPWYGSGRTFNTEYCLNTGLYVPIDYNIFSTRDNNYKYSMANMFKDNGYQTSTIHFNDGSFYDRVNMHKSYGYDNTYFLADMTGNYYYNDSDVTNNEEFYNLMISKDSKFLTFFTTYSAHLPYNVTNNLCKKQSTEEECIKKLAKHTDDAVKILIEKLKRDNLLEDTVIVFVTDHYAYGYHEIEKIKGGNDSVHLDKIPFFIWNNNEYIEVIDKYVDTQDILPTILNLFGIEYENVYIGTDIFSDNHNNYVYFSDNTYVGDVENISIKESQKEIDVNEWIIKTDYYNK